MLYLWSEVNKLDCSPTQTPNRVITWLLKSVSIQHCWNVGIIFLVYYLGSANNGRVVSIPLWASEEGTKRVIWDLFPALQQTDFDYMRVDNRRRLCHIPPDFATPKAWKDSKILGRSALYIRPKTKINEVVYPIIWNHCKDQIVLRTMTHSGLEMIWLFFSWST